MKELNMKKADYEQFPEIYSGVAGEFSELYSNYLESPREFFYMTFLTCHFGTVLVF